MTCHIASPRRTSPEEKDFWVEDVFVRHRSNFDRVVAPASEVDLLERYHREHKDA